MKLTVQPRHPKWIIISAYVGNDEDLKGLYFPTRFTYYKKKIALGMAALLNNRVKNYSRFPGRRFEFQVIPNDRSADPLKEV